MALCVQVKDKLMTMMYASERLGCSEVVAVSLNSSMRSYKLVKKSSQAT